MKQKTVLSWKPVFLTLFAVLIILPVTLTQCKKDTLPRYGNPEHFVYMTEINPPFNYMDDSQLSGVSVDLLESIFKKLNVSVDRTAIKVYDWKSAYESVLVVPNTMLFSMVKTPERADLFKWVGPIAPFTEIVLTLKDSGILIKEITELNNFFTGVVDGYSSIDLLMDRGVLRPNIIVYEDLTELYKALVVNREIQCISTSQTGHNLIIQGLGFSPQLFTAPFMVHSDDLYFAFNVETADQMITDFQDKLIELKADMTEDGSSEYEKIMNRYHIIQHADDGITEDMVIALVNRTSADLTADAAGTIAKINQGQAPYKDSQNPALYSFVYNTDVVMVAHATNTLLVGTSFAGKPDVTGKNFRDDIVQGAMKNGTGWVDYVYTKPDQSGLYNKTTYYKLTLGSDSKQYVVCAGKYK